MDHVKVDVDMESMMIDATIVRAHACASGIKGNQEEAALGVEAKVVLVLKFMPSLMHWVTH